MNDMRLWVICLTLGMMFHGQGMTGFFSRYWRTELDQDMIDRADMVKELIMFRDGVLSGSVDFTPEDVQTLITF